MSRFNQKRNNVEPDQIYFDVNVTNFQSATKKPVAFTYNESRTNPFINNPEDYYLSILRFTIDSGTIPVFIPSIQPDQADKDLTIYSVSMSYSPTDSYPAEYNVQTFVKWIPEDLSVQAPLAPSLNFNKLQNNTTGYYNCYSYTWLSFLITNALGECFEDLKTLVNTAIPNTIPATVRQPLFAWDSTSQKAIVYANADYFDLNYIAGISPDYPINIYMNAQLYGLFSSFPTRFLGYGTDFGEDARILLLDVGGTNIQPLIPPQIAPVPPATYDSYLAIALYQETSTTSNISPITAIVFTSNTLPCESNQVSTPIVLSDNVSLVQSTNNSATSPIITDLVSDSGIYTPNLVYTPTSQYRLITLYGNSPLHNLDLQIYYRLRDSSLIPFTLQSGGSITCKLAFLKKSANNTKFF
jgi:hypothetical protein